MMTTEGLELKALAATAVRAAKSGYLEAVEIQTAVGTWRATRVE